MVLHSLCFHRDCLGGFDSYRHGVPLCGAGGRPFWNSSIVGPRFLASAFTAGPALIILALQVIRRVTDYRITDKALLTLRNIVQVSMLINVFLLCNEVFKEFYSRAPRMSLPRNICFFGLHGYHALVPWIWTAIAFNLIAMVHPGPAGEPQLEVAQRRLRARDRRYLDRKRHGPGDPGFHSDAAGEMVEYSPTLNETLVCLGIWAFRVALLHGVPAHVGADPAG